MDIVSVEELQNSESVPVLSFARTLLAFVCSLEGWQVHVLCTSLQNQGHTILNSSHSWTFSKVYRILKSSEVSKNIIHLILKSDQQLCKTLHINNFFCICINDVNCRKHVKSSISVSFMNILILFSDESTVLANSVIIFSPDTIHSHLTPQHLGVISTLCSFFYTLLYLCRNNAI